MSEPVVKKNMTSRRQLPPPNRNALYIGLIVAVVILAGFIGWAARGWSDAGQSSQRQSSQRQSSQQSERVAANEPENQSHKSDPDQASADNEKETVPSTDDKKNLESSEPAIKETSGLRDASFGGVETSDEVLDTPKVRKTGPPKLADLSNYKKNPNREPVRLPKTNGSSRKQSRITLDPPKSTDSSNANSTSEKEQDNSYSFPQQSTPIVIYQELIIDRHPEFQIEGIRSIKQDFKYRTISQLTVHSPDRNGIRQVSQKVVAAKLISSDAMSRKPITESLNKLVGQEFQFSMDRHQQLVDFKGKVEKPAATDAKDLESLSKLLGEGLSGEGFLVSSVMDLDGWKEMAQMTFLLPDDKRTKWSGQMEHDWGDLGRWVGETKFEKKARTGGKLRIDYAHWMRYEKADKTKGGLPFELGDVAFKSDEAGGQMLFDTEKRRIHSLVERFHVEGTLSASLLSKGINLKIKEVQAFELFLHDQLPQ